MASHHYEGTSTSCIDIPQAELRARLKTGESLEDIVDELFYDPDYAEVDESDNDPFADPDTTIESVLGVGRYDAQGSSSSGEPFGEHLSQNTTAGQEQVEEGADCPRCGKHFVHKSYLKGHILSKMCPGRPSPPAPPSGCKHSGVKTSKPSLTLGGMDGLSLDGGKVRVRFLDDHGRPAVFQVVDDFSRNDSVVFASRGVVRPVIKSAEQLPEYKWPIDMCLRIPVYVMQDGVAYIRLGGVEHAVKPFLNIPWLKHKIGLK